MKKSPNFYLIHITKLLIIITSSIINISYLYGSENTMIKDINILNKKAGVVLCRENGDILYSQNENKGFIPASTIKVLTSLAALNYLGTDYKFNTCFFLSLSPNKSLDLKIKGYGDPLFTSNIIDEVCKELSVILKSLNVKVINDIIVDDSFFASNIEIDGKSNSNNPYDAFNGALSANFNSISFKYNKVKHLYISDDPEIPLLPLAIKRITLSGLREGRVVLSKQESRIYSGMLIGDFLLKNNFIIKGDIKTGVAAKNDKLIYTFTSPYSLDEIIRRMLKYSNNFMANQLFLSAGAKAFSPPATVEKGVAAMNQYAAKVLGISKSVFVEGSGLSRKNRIYPEDMIKILKIFRPYYQLMKSEKMKNGVTEYYKTGTLDGVRTRCGYFETSKELYPFVIMVNQYGVGYENIREVLSKSVSIQN